MLSFAKWIPEHEFMTSDQWDWFSLLWAQPGGAPRILITKSKFIPNLLHLKDLKNYSPVPLPSYPMKTLFSLLKPFDWHTVHVPAWQRATIWKSYTLISPGHLTPSSLVFWRICWNTGKWITIMDTELPYQLPKACEDTEVCFRYGSLQHRGWFISCSPFTLQISCTIQPTAICKLLWQPFFSLITDDDDGSTRNCLRTWMTSSRGTASRSMD